MTETLETVGQPWVKLLSQLDHETRTYLGIIMVAGVIGGTVFGPRGALIGAGVGLSLCVLAPTRA
jgi:hypothetical protein